MNTIIQSKLSSLLLILTLFALTGCSVIDSYRIPNQRPAVSLPKIPEIKRQKVFKPRYTPPKKAVARAPVKLNSQVKSSSYQIKNKTVDVKPKLTQQQQIEEQQRLQQQAKQNATVEIDPYASIPESSTNQKSLSTSTTKNTSTITSLSSPAVKSLMTSARADIAIGRSRSAISKLERGLRIEPQNARLWHLLAKAHYSNSAYLHSISIAKKSNANTNDRDLINENWKLIKQAGERSGNASAIKEALDYIKLNP